MVHTWVPGSARPAGVPLEDVLGLGWREEESAGATPSGVAAGGPGTAGRGPSAREEDSGQPALPSARTAPRGHLLRTETPEGRLEDGKVLKMPYSCLERLIMLN